MAKTPHHLRMLGVPEDCGPDRAVPRVIEGYVGPYKKEAMSLYFSKIFARALPEWNAPEIHFSEVTHARLAAMNGVRRETISRRIGKLSRGTKKWDEAQRRKRSMEETRRAAAQGKRVRVGRRKLALRSLEPVAELFEVTPRFNAPNLYKGPKGAVGGKNDPCRAARDAAEKYGTKNFDSTAHVNGFKRIDAVIWHPTLPDVVPCECKMGQARLPFQGECPTCGGKGKVFKGSLPDFGRNFLTLLQMWGIEDEIPELRDNDDKIVRKHKPAGMLQIPQWKMAQRMGCDEDTLRKYQRKAEALLFIKVVDGDKYGACPSCAGGPVLAKAKVCPSCHANIAGKVRITSSDPDKIIWMPGRLMEHEMCLAERQRFLEAKAKLADQSAAWKADQVHLELISGEC